jgi:DNA damage-binding protein 1
LVIRDEKDVKGSVNCLSGFVGGLLAGINSKLIFWKWKENSSEYQLVQEIKHPINIMIVTLQTKGDFILVGDLMRSITVLVYKQVDGTIEEIARDENTSWISSSDFIDTDTFISSDNDYNITVYQKETDSINEELKRLNPVGYYNYGDYINKFSEGSLIISKYYQNTEFDNMKTTLFVTINGSIGIIASIPKNIFEFFLDVQESLTKVIKGVGLFSHTNFRSYKQYKLTNPSFNFIDGDLIESFLDLSLEKMNEVVKNLKNSINVTDLIKKIEDISRRLH